MVTTSNTRNTLHSLPLTRTIDYLRLRIEDAVGTPPDQQRLYFLGHGLEDGRTLAEYNIVNNSNILLFPKQHPSEIGRRIQTFIKTLTGSIITLQDIVPLTYIDEMKWRIQNMEGIPKHQQRLIYAGHQLEDGRTVGQYDI